MQTVRPGERETERRIDSRRLPRVDDADIDGVLYRLGRLQRVHVDVRSQVRELRTYASGARVECDVTEVVGSDLLRRLDRVEEALGAIRDDFDATRDAVDVLIDGSGTPDADVITLQRHSLPAGA